MIAALLQSPRAIVVNQGKPERRNRRPRIGIAASPQNLRHLIGYIHASTRGLYAATGGKAMRTGRQHERGCTIYIRVHAAACESVARVTVPAVSIAEAKGVQNDEGGGGVRGCAGLRGGDRSLPSVDIALIMPLHYSNAAALL